MRTRRPAHPIAHPVTGSALGSHHRLVSILACLMLALFTSAPAHATDLQTEIERIINASGLENASIGVHVIDVRRNHILAARDADDLYLPASNMKLLTSGAALSILGPDYVFETRVAIDPVPGSPRADVWLVGDGDPALADPAVLIQMEPPLDISSFLGVLGDRVAESLNGRPLRSLIVDDRIFDRAFVPASWPVEQLNMSYAPEVAGLNIHANVLRVFPMPAETVGSPPVLVVEPESPWASFENRARTVASGQHTAWIARPKPENRYTVFGSVPQSRRVGVEVALHDPALFFGRLLARSIADRGVKIEASQNISGTLADEAARAGSDDLATILRAVRRAGEAEEPRDPVDIVVVRTPLLDVIDRCNKASENLYAEALLKRIGHDVTNEPGSLENGAAVIRMVMRELVGPDAVSDLHVGDGSGFSRENLVSPRILTRWLSAIARTPEIGDAFYNSLPMPREHSTTLQRRFSATELDTEVRAKSGSIDGVRCLSGYVRSRDGSQLIAFSVLINDLKRSEHAKALRLHEIIVEAIDDYVHESAALAEVSPGG